MPTPTPAEALRATALFFESDTSRWGREFFVARGGCSRCSLGGIAFVVAPDGPGDPWDLDDEPGDVAVAAAQILADYLQAEGMAVRDDYDHIVPSATPTALYVVGDWNDAPGRTVHEVIGTLRSAARWSEERAAVPA